jgi:hypothetical protein
MQIAKARENNLSMKIKIALTRYWPHPLNQPRLCINLYRALKLAIMIGNPSLNAQHGQPFWQR